MLHSIWSLHGSWEHPMVCQGVVRSQRLSSFANSESHWVGANATFCQISFRRWVFLAGRFKHQPFKQLGDDPPPKGSSHTFLLLNACCHAMLSFSSFRLDRKGRTTQAVCCGKSLQSLSIETNHQRGATSIPKLICRGCKSKKALEKTKPSAVNKWNEMLREGMRLRVGPKCDPIGLAQRQECSGQHQTGIDVNLFCNGKNERSVKFLYVHSSWRFRWWSTFAVLASWLHLKSHLMSCHQLLSQCWQRREGHKCCNFFG